MNDLLVRARALPTVCRTGPDGQPLTKPVQVIGSKLTQADMAPGQTLNPNIYYSAKKFVDVDHYQTMIELYKEKGPDGVLDYEDATKALKRFTMDQIKKPWYVRLTEWFYSFKKK